MQFIIFFFKTFSLGRPLNYFFLPILLEILIFCAPLSATPKDDLRYSEDAFVYGDYKDVIKTCEVLLYPESKLETKEDEIRALELLGVSHGILNEDKIAKDVFLTLLLLKPNHELNPLVIPPRIIKIFEEVKSDNKTQLDKIRQQQKVEIVSEKTIYVELVRTENSRMINLFPFGVGQFQNDDMEMGVFFLVFEALALGTNIFSYSMVESLRGETGYYTPENAEIARTFQNSQYISLGVFGALVLWGIIDAMINYEGERSIKVRSLEKLPKEYMLPPMSDTKSTFQLTPVEIRITF